MKTFIYKTTQILLIALIVATVAHAFYQSSLPTKQSIEQSDKIGQIVGEIIPPETKPGDYVQKNIRKLAHFTEFFFLGLWTGAYVFIFLRKRGALSLLLPFGIIVALLDETVQIFSKRGSSVKDVWIDTFGYVSAILLLLLVFLAILAIRHIRRIRRGRISI